MASNDWYQNRMWSDEIRDAFLVRARRSRAHRFHYFLNQAGTLCEAGLAKEALDLLEEIRCFQPKHHVHMRTELARAECLVQLGEHASAIEAFRASFAIMRTTARDRTDTEISFAKYVVDHDRSDLLPELEARLREFPPLITTPRATLYFNAACALIFVAKGEALLAAQHARKALDAASATSSGWPRHPTHGLVTDLSPTLSDRLVAIATA